MNVIWHGDKFVHNDRWESIGHFHPYSLDHFSGRVQLHPTLNHIAEMRHPSMCDNGNKVRPCLRIVVSLQSHRPAMMDFRIVHAVHLSDQPPWLFWIMLRHASLLFNPGRPQGTPLQME